MTDGTEPEKKSDGEETTDEASDGETPAQGAPKDETLREETSASGAASEDMTDPRDDAEPATTEAKSEEASSLSEEDDEMTHAADEPTAMWGVNALKELGLDVAPEEESRPATEGTGRHKAIGVDFSDGAAPVTTPKKQSNAVWIGLVLVLLGAAIAVAAVRFM